MFQGGCLYRTQTLFRKGFAYIECTPVRSVTTDSYSIDIVTGYSDKLVVSKVTKEPSTSQLSNGDLLGPSHPSPHLPECLFFRRRRQKTGFEDMSLRVPSDWSGYTRVTGPSKSDGGQTVGVVEDGVETGRLFKTGEEYWSRKSSS